MNNNKKRGKKSKTKKEYKLSEYKTKEERQEQVKTIIKEITNLGLSIQYEPVKDSSRGGGLFSLFRSHLPR